jgi:DNA polymerase-3 subunit delta'
MKGRGAGWGDGRIPLLVRDPKSRIVVPLSRSGAQVQSSETPAALLGNHAIRAQLAQLADSGRLHHCLLFEGPVGVGKATTALWLAQRMNCTDPVDGEACGACWSCRAIQKGHHPDVIVVGTDPERTAPVVSVRQARELIGSLALRPHSAKRRFIIIDPADAMNAASANALLKTFEEPPQDTGFVLVTGQPGALLSTVRSRSQSVRFARVSVGELAEWLAAREVTDPAWVANLSDGCPGRALELANGEAEAWRQARDELLDALGGDISGVFAFGENRAKGDRAKWTGQMLLALDGLDRMLQDTWRWQVKGPLPADRLFNPRQRRRIAAWAERLDPPALARCVEAVEEARGQLRAFVNGRMMADALLCRLATELGAARRVS